VGASSTGDGAYLSQVRVTIKAIVAP